MKKKGAVALLLTLVMCFSLCACGGKTTTVEITNDNWEEYFEIVIEPIEPTENDFGIIGTGHSAAYLVLKDGYEFDVENTSLAIDFKVVNECRFAELKDNEVIVGDVYESRGVETYEDTETIDSGKVMLCASYPYGTTPDGKDFWAILDSCEMVNIEGTLTVIE